MESRILVKAEEETISTIFNTGSYKGYPVCIKMFQRKGRDMFKILIRHEEYVTCLKENFCYQSFENVIGMKHPRKSMLTQKDQSGR